MIAVSATEVRKNWSETLDTVAHKRPVFMRRTHDDSAIMNTDTLRFLLKTYNITATVMKESDGTCTLSCNEMDIVVNEPTRAEAKKSLANDIIEYALDFYSEFNLWSVAPNRKMHLPYIMKALTADNADELGDSIICQDGEN